MTPVRRAALECLPKEKGVFLRCDRGDALYVTNAPMRTDKRIAWERMGFCARNEGRLTFLIPHAVWVDEFAAWAQGKVRKKWLTKSMQNICCGDALEEDMRLWIDGIKRLEMKGNAGQYEKLVRQRAAVCLREKRGGGTLIACALIVDMMNEGGLKDED